MNNLSVTLLVTTYNRPRALELCLDSILKQTRLPEEIVIADDGSGAPTKDVIEHYQQIFNIPIIHVWQPDEGFQLSKIRNRAIAAASQNYIIQIDGDILAHPRFVEDHLYYAAPRSCVCPRRARLTPAVTQQWEAGTVPAFVFWPLTRQYAKENLYALRSRFLCNLTIRLIADFRTGPHIMGANMSYWRQDAIEVNGFDESYTTWGLEDLDFSLRLRHAGVTLKCLRFAANEFHLYHPSEAKKSVVNSEQFNQCAAQKRIRAEKGLDQYL